MEENTFSSNEIFGNTLVRLLGANAGYRFDKDYPVSVWKKKTIYIFKRIRRFIEVNIELTDAAHKKKLMELCDRAVENMKMKNSRHANAKDTYSTYTITYLMDIIFELLGGCPDLSSQSNLGA